MEFKTLRGVYQHVSCDTQGWVRHPGAGMAQNNWQRRKRLQVRFVNVTLFVQIEWIASYSDRKREQNGVLVGNHLLEWFELVCEYGLSIQCHSAMLKVRREHLQANCWLAQILRTLV